MRYEKHLRCQKPLKTLFLNLAVSDLGVGLLSEPFYIWLMVRWSRLNIPSCTAFNAFFFPVRLFAITSYLTVVAISLESFLAIHFHLRYQEIVTHKRVIALVFSIWIISLFINLFDVFLSSPYCFCNFFSYLCCLYPCNDLYLLEDLYSFKASQRTNSSSSATRSSTSSPKWKCGEFREP